MRGIVDRGAVECVLVISRRCGVAIGERGVIGRHKVHWVYEVCGADRAMIGDEDKSIVPGRRSRAVRCCSDLAGCVV